MAAIGLILSLAIGVSLGLLGGGGSILTVPVVHYVFGIGAHDAIAMSLVIVAITSVVALIPHAGARRVRWGTGMTFGVASMTAAFVGGIAGKHLPGATLMVAFGVVMVAAGVAMLLRARRPLTPVAPKPPSRILTIGIGVGFLTGILGTGGGFLIVPALTLTAGLAMRDAIGTSLLIIAMNSAAGLAGTAAHASIDLRIVLPITAIALAGSFVGVRIGKRLSPQTLQRAFGWFVITLAVVILVHELT